jgi:hypothetical protein
MAASTASGHTSLRAFQAEIDKVKSDAQKARHEQEVRLAAEQASSHGQKKHTSAKFQAHNKETAKKAGAEPPASPEGQQKVEHVDHEESLEVC